MIDFAKLYCDLHPHQIVSNFCIKETCMIGLCATCICTHTEYHVLSQTSPEYQNIRNTFSNMHETIRKQISQLQYQKNRIEKISQFILTKRNAIKQNVEETKKIALAAVQNYFDNKQKSMLRQMESEQKKMSVHSEARMESLMNSLNRETSILIASAQELNSQSFLESYQRIKSQTLFNASKLNEEIIHELERNEDFETIINANNQFTIGMNKALEQSLLLSFKISSKNKGMKADFQSIYQTEPIYHPASIYHAQPIYHTEPIQHAKPIYHTEPIQHAKPIPIPQIESKNFLRDAFYQKKHAQEQFSPHKFEQLPVHHNRVNKEHFKQTLTPRFQKQIINVGSSYPALPQRQKIFAEPQFFSSISFGKVPEHFQQQNGGLNSQVEQCFKHTSKSIKLDQGQKPPLITSGQQRSFAHEFQSLISKEFATGQSQILKQRDINQKGLQQILRGSTILRQKPFLFEQKLKNNPTLRYFNQSNIGQSISQYSRQNRIQQRPNNSSQMSIRSNSVSVNPHIYNKPITRGQKVNFTPQILSDSQFNQNLQNSQNISAVLEYKKDKKSGLSLFKTSLPDSTSRSKIIADKNLLL